MKIVLVGAGAQAKYALEIFHTRADLEVVGLIDIMDNHEIWGKELHGAHVLGGVELLGDLTQRGIEGALVCCDQPARKANLTQLAIRTGFERINAVHPRAVVASTAQIGSGVIINAGAVIQPFARVDDGVMIHANVVVEHDNVIERFVNLAPATCLAGWVTVREGAVVYSSATVAPRVTIGCGAVVAAGSVVLEDVPDRTLVAGVPARSVRELDAD